MKLARLTYLLGCLFAAGCSDIYDGIPVFALTEVGADIACASNSDCQNDEKCVAYRCAIVSKESIDIALRMSYPQAPDVPVISYHQLTPGESIGDFTMPQMQNVRIYAKYKGEWINGNLSITRADAWPGLDAEQKGQLSIVEKNSFQMQMVPGIYNITVFPADTSAELPTMYFENVEISSESNEIILDSAYGTEKNGTDTSDLYVRYHIFLPTQSDSADISLTIKDVASPASTAHYTLSSAQNDNLTSLRMPPQNQYDTREYQVLTAQKVTPTLTINQTLNTFKIGPVPPEDGRDIVVYGDVLPIDINAFASTEIRGRVMSSTTVTPAGASVTIAGTTDNLSWTSRSHEETSNDGYFIVDMPQGLPKSDCEVRIVYPSDSVLASRTVKTKCPFDTDQLIVNVSPKNVIRGSVFNESTSAPVDNARLYFSPSDSIGGDIEITTAGNGSFEVALDDKQYNVTISAPRPDGLPPTHIQVDGTNVGILNLSLKRGELVYGSCHDEDGDPIGDVRTEVYVRQNGTARRLNVSESDIYGTFRLFIPMLSTLR